jgi:hypothetical protein
MLRMRCQSDEDRSAVDHYGLPGAERLLHQKQVSLRYVVRFAFPGRLGEYGCAARPCTCAESPMMLSGQG